LKLDKKRANITKVHVEQAQLGGRAGVPGVWQVVIVLLVHHKAKCPFLIAKNWVGLELKCGFHDGEGEEMWQHLLITETRQEQQQDSDLYTVKGLYARG